MGTINESCAVTFKTWQVRSVYLYVFPSLVRALVFHKNGYMSKIVGTYPLRDVDADDLRSTQESGRAPVPARYSRSQATERPDGSTSVCLMKPLRFYRNSHIYKS